MVGPQKALLESHLLVCEQCSSELELMRMLVGGLRSLPVVHPPADFTSRVLARWNAERHEPVAPHLVAEPPPCTPGEAPLEPPAFAPYLSPPVMVAYDAAAAQAASQAASQAVYPAGAAPVPPPVPPVSQPLYAPGPWAVPRPQGPQPRRSAGASALRPARGLIAALFAVMLGVGLVGVGTMYPRSSDVRQSNLAPIAPIKEFAHSVRRAIDLRLEPAATTAMVSPTLPLSPTLPSASRCPASECDGHANEWVPMRMRLVFANPELVQCFHHGEVVVCVPSSMQVAYNADSTPGQVLTIPVHIDQNGHWQGELRWRAMGPGRYPAWVESRIGGAFYQQRPVVFSVTR